MNINKQVNLEKETVNFLVDSRALAAEIIRTGSGDERLGKEENGANNEEGRPWLVFLHEGLGSVGQWRDFPSALCATTGLNALVYDRWGYGKAEACPEVGNVAYLHHEALEVLPRVLEHFGIDKAVCIGHSDGGSIALMFAAAYPERTSAVITEAAHVFVEEVTLAGIRAAVAVYETTDLKTKLMRYHGDKTDMVFRRWSETWLSPAFRTWNIEEYLPRVRCPVLAVQGRDDPYGTPAQVEAIVRQTSGPAEGLLVPDCGHIPHFQAPEKIRTAMTDFIGRCLAGKTTSNWR